MVLVFFYYLPSSHYSQDYGFYESFESHLKITQKPLEN